MKTNGRPLLFSQEKLNMHPIIFYAMYKGDIPFCRATGNPMYYPENGYMWEYQGRKYESLLAIEHRYGEAAVKQAQRITVPPDWRPNTPFRAVLTIKDFSRGRSAANFDLEDDSGIQYTMFLKDFLELVQCTKIDAGKTEYLTWVFCKQGQNYGIQLADG